MAIVSSVIVEDARQADGRRWVCERHTDALGVAIDVRYLAAANADVAALMAARASSVAADETAQEIAANLAGIATDGQLFTPTFRYSTAAQNAAALRAVYQFATRTQAIFIGDFLSTPTDVQLQNAFGLTAGQVTTLRSNKLTPAATQAAAIRTAVGQ